MLGLWTIWAALMMRWLRGDSYLALILMPLFGAWATFHSFHDASHGALSVKPWVNYLMVVLTSPMIITPYEWMLQHVIEHHVSTNVDDEDPDVKHVNRWRKLHNPRSALAWLVGVWAIAVPIGLQMLEPLRFYKKGPYGANRQLFYSSLLMRLLQLCVFYLYPVVAFGFFKGFAWASVPAVVFSYVFMFNTQLSHLNIKCFDGQQTIQKLRSRNWFKHQLKTTADLAPESWLYWFISGGLNIQSMHHLFPTVNHVHIPALRQALLPILEEHHVNLVVFPGYLQAFWSHWELLRYLAYSESKKGDSIATKFKAPDKPMAGFWYKGVVTHSRKKSSPSDHEYSKADHSFHYNVELALFDLDLLDMPDAAEPLPPPGLFGYRSSIPSFLRFAPEDHLRFADESDIESHSPHNKKSSRRIPKSEAHSPRKHKYASELAEKIRERVSYKLGTKSSDYGKVQLLTMPRRLGYVFNPLSVYYVHGGLPDDHVKAVVLEVSNTPWNEEYCYVLPYNGEKEISITKMFHVSPFMPMGTKWVWTLPAPSNNLYLKCDVLKGDDKFFRAEIRANRKPFDAWHTLVHLLGAPFATFRVQWAIHAEAWSLFRKGNKFYPHPTGTKTFFSQSVNAVFQYRKAAVATVLLAVLVPLLQTAALYPTLIFVTTTGTLIISLFFLLNATNCFGFKSTDQNNSTNAVMARENSITDNIGAQMPHQQKICIVGSGISGNGAAYFLKDTSHSITLLEKEKGRFGGHAQTVEHADLQEPVDIGFQVYNLTNYPLLSRLFDELGVNTIESDMSLSIKTDEVEWASKLPFPTLSDTLRVHNWKRLFEVLRFEYLAKKALREVDQDPCKSDRCHCSESMTIQQFLDKHGFSASLRDEYIVPMCGAIWSCSSTQVQNFPAPPIFQFLRNHWMLDRSRPRWRTPKHRSSDYVDKLQAALKAHGVECQSGIEVARVDKLQKGGVRVVSSKGTVIGDFDRVCFATHAPDTLAILRRSSGWSQEDKHSWESIIGRCSYESNKVVIHKDARLMPDHKSAWSAWNSASRNIAGETKTYVTYWLNALQHVEGCDIFVSVSVPDGIIDEALIITSYTMDHPRMDAAAQHARSHLQGIQGLADRLYFAGAWTGFGFHEDGLRSAYFVAKRLGARLKYWTPIPSPFTRLNVLEKMCWSILQLGLPKMIKTGFLRIIHPDGSDNTFGSGSNKDLESIGLKAEEVVLQVHSAKFFGRMILDPGMGFAEAYMNAEISVKPDIGDFFRLVLGNKKQNDHGERLLTDNVQT